MACRVFCYGWEDGQMEASVSLDHGALQDLLQTADVSTRCLLEHHRGADTSIRVVAARAQAPPRAVVYVVATTVRRTDEGRWEATERLMDPLELGLTRSDAWALLRGAPRRDRGLHHVIGLAQTPKTVPVFGAVSPDHMSPHSR